MGYIAKRYSSCEFSDAWEDQGFKLVTVNEPEGTAKVCGVVNRKAFEAKEDNAKIKITDDRGAEITVKFQKQAVVLLGEHTISYRPEEKVKQDEDKPPTRGTA